MLPEKFPNDGDGRKAALLKDIETALKDMMEQRDKGTLPPSKLRYPAYKKQQPLFEEDMEFRDSQAVSGADAFGPRKSFSHLNLADRADKADKIDDSVVKGQNADTEQAQKQQQKGETQATGGAAQAATAARKIRGQGATAAAAPNLPSRVQSPIQDKLKGLFASKQQKQQQEEEAVSTSLSTSNPLQSVEK